MSGHIAEADLAVYALAPESQGARQRAQIAAHLAECAACQQTCDFFAVSEEVVSEKVLDKQQRDPLTWEPAVGSDTRRAIAEYSELVAEEDREAAELLKEYLQNPITAAWQLLVTKRRLRTSGVVRALIRAAHNAYEDDPLAALTFADNAIAIAEGLEDERYPRSTAAQLRATAWKERANAQIFLGRFPEAHRSLDTAERFHRRYTPNGLGLAIVAIVRAGLLYAQECFDEAMVVAERAERGFAHAGEEKRRMDAVFLRASILMHAGRPSEARPLFQQTIQYADEVRNPRLLARNSYALGNCEVDLRDLGEASIHFHRALVIFRELGPAVRRIETEWGIARIVLHSNRYEDAIRRLRDIATDFERLEMVTQAAYVGIDIMEALLALNKPRRIIALAQHLISTFSKAGMLTGALSAFAYLKEAAASGTLTVNDLATVRTFLRRAELQPNLPFDRPRNTPS